MKRFYRFVETSVLLTICIVCAYLFNEANINQNSSIISTLTLQSESICEYANSETTDINESTTKQTINQCESQAIYTTEIDTIASVSASDDNETQISNTEPITEINETQICNSEPITEIIESVKNTENTSEPVADVSSEIKIEITETELVTENATNKTIKEAETERTSNNITASQPESTEQTSVTDSMESEIHTEVLTEINTVETSENITEKTEKETSSIILSSSVTSETSDAYKSFGKTYSGALLSADDKDVYLFNVQERGYISFTLSHESFKDSGGWLVTLENEYYVNGISGTTSFRKISTLICKSDNTTHKSVNIGVIPGNYKVTVTPYLKTVSIGYSLKVSFTVSDDYEIECNDTKSRYSDLTPGKSLYGSASFADSTDTDWYMLNMYSNGVIKLKFEHSTVNVATVLWKIYLYDSSGNELYSENSFGSSKSIDSGNIGLSAGTYYIKVESRVYSNVIYTITAERINTSVYELENNDSITTATSATLNKVIYGNTASRYSKADKDYYKFKITKAGVCTLTFTHDKIDTDTDKTGWNVTFIDSSGNILYYIESSYLKTKITSSAIGLASGTYYVCIDCDNCYRVDEDYSVKLTYKQNLSYETEFNNTFSKADKLLSGTPLSGNLIKNKNDYDNDCYYFTLSKTGKIDLTFSHIIATSEKNYYCISLYDSKGNKVDFYTSEGNLCKGTLSCSAKKKSFKISAELSAGKYYFRVSVGDYFSDSVYTINYKETVY